jgi:hypothetical protein
MTSREPFNPRAPALSDASLARPPRADNSAGTFVRARSRAPERVAGLEP